MRKLIAALIGAGLVLVLLAASHGAEAQPGAATTVLAPENVVGFPGVGPDGRLLRLDPTDPLHGAGGAWRAPGVVRQLRAIAWDQAWIKIRRAPGIEPKNLRARGIYQVGPDAGLHFVDDPHVIAVDVDGSLWRLGNSSVLIDGEWLRVGRGKAIGIHGGTVWNFRQTKEAARCDTELGPGQKAVEFTRSTLEGSVTFPCATLPDLRFDRGDRRRAYIAAAGLAGELYLASAVADPDNPSDSRSYRHALFRIDGGGWEEIALPQDFSAGQRDSDAIWVGANGDLWVSWVSGPDERTYARRDGNRWIGISVTIDWASGLPARRIWDNPDDRFSIGPDGRAWVAVGNELIVIDGATARTVLTADGIHAVSVAPDGAIWVGVGTTVHLFPADWLLPATEEPDTADPWAGIAIAATIVAAVAIATFMARRSRHRKQGQPE